MELTEKCFKDFLSFFNSKRRGTEVGFYQLPELFQNALIIEFFDSVGIVININVDTNNEANSCEDGCENCDSCYDTWNSEYEYCIYTFTKIENNTNDYVSYFCEDKFDLRIEATNSAIEKANEIYNKNN